MRRSFAMFLAGALLLTAACSGGDDDNGGDTDGPARTLFQPSGVVGPDSFSPSFAAATYQASAAARATSTTTQSSSEPAPAPIEPGSTVSGSTPGLYAGRTYGGTGANICDIEKMIAFLTFYEDRGRAWAAIQGIAFEDLDTYLRGLTPVFTLQNINVTMFGFKNGQSYGYPAVMEAGTAILIDEQGMPRARCACGNPLLGPTEDIPEGTDEPTPDEPDDGNPQTQDSVPDETGDVPVDEPQPEREPRCPDWNSPNPQYVDTDGMLWQYNPFTGKWISLDDPSLVNIPDEELPGFLERCGDPGRQVTPECPFWNSSTEQWASPAEFIDQDGNRWVGQEGTDEWSRVGTDERRLLSEIPGYVERCLDPTDSEPTCPSPVSDGWTPYQNAFGETFEYALLAGWTSTATGERFEDLEDIPGYVEECGAPGTDTPCPPLYPLFNQQWRASSGKTWVYVQAIFAGTKVLGWIDIETGEVWSREELYREFCGDLRTEQNPEPLCPPSNPARNEVWIDTAGNTWVYGAANGGSNGWDDTSTVTVEVVPTSELPNTPEGCERVDPPRHWACPPILDISEGSTYRGSNGSLYVWTPASGGWVGEAGDVIVYTVLLPGFRQRCLPPCPPIDAHKQSVTAVWVDPSTGHIWVKPSGWNEWINIYTQERVGDSASLPFWKEECLPPCAPGSNGEPTFARDEDGRPVSDPERSGALSFDPDDAITISPALDNVTPQPIVPEFLRAMTATGDDCNPNGCIDLTRPPALGHYFIDSYGIAWRYSDNDIWQSENGESVYSVFDIPGYGTACLPDDTTPQRECPEEFEGNRYTDSRNITWTWVGANVTAAESTHDKKWFTRHADGSFEYRHTFQLDSFLADCPKPEGLDEALDIVFGVRLPRDVCAGDDVNFTFTVIELVPGATVEYELAIDGEIFSMDVVGEGVYVIPWSPSLPGSYMVTVFATSSGGQRGEAAFAIEVFDCDDPVPDNTPPTIELGFRPTCVEAPSSGETELIVFVVISDVDGDTVDVRVDGGSAERRLVEQTASVDGSGEVAVSYLIGAEYRGQVITIDVVADDGTAATSASGSVRVESPGGCSASPATAATTTPTPTTPTPTTTAPTTTAPTTTTTRPPATTRPPSTTTTTRPPATTTTTTAAPRPNNAPDVDVDLSSTYDANNQLCTVRVSAVDADPGQTVSIGVSGDAVSSTFGEVIRVYTIKVGPNTRASIQDQYPGHAVFDSAGARIPVSITVEARLGNNGYSCVRV